MFCTWQQTEGSDVGCVLGHTDCCCWCHASAVSVAACNRWTIGPVFWRLRVRMTGVTDGKLYSFCVQQLTADSALGSVFREVRVIMTDTDVLEKTLPWVLCSGDPWVILLIMTVDSDVKVMFCVWLLTVVLGVFFRRHESYNDRCHWCQVDVLYVDSFW